MCHRKAVLFFLREQQSNCLTAQHRQKYTCGEVGGLWERKKSPQRVGWKVEADGFLISSWPEPGPSSCPDAILSPWTTPCSMYSQPAEPCINGTHLCFWEISMDVHGQRKDSCLTLQLRLVQGLSLSVSVSVSVLSHTLSLSVDEERMQLLIHGALLI